ncbi:hypothetical protein HGRIS_007396 [Hohenbuehelia grisea]|uniref:Uncharacterized protein n=1 Tax=Hohenbuehelia grisea TaxID=104357 RepID=A0ABR3J4N3_9AGAR
MSVCQASTMTASPKTSSLAATQAGGTPSFSSEDLARRQVRYMNIGAEEAQYVSLDASRRDRVYKELVANDPCILDLNGLMKSPAAKNPDAYLEAVDATLDSVPITYEDHMMRAFYAGAATMVFQEFKVRPIKRTNPEVYKPISKRVNQLHTEFIHNYLSPKYGLGLPLVPSTVENVLNPLKPNEVLPSSRSMTIKDIQDIIAAPHKSLEIKFMLLRNNSGDECKWEVTSFTQDRKSGVSFEVLFEGSKETIRMDVDEMRNLLEDSQVLR